MLRGRGRVRDPVAGASPRCARSRHCRTRRPRRRLCLSCCGLIGSKTPDVTARTPQQQEGHQQEAVLLVPRGWWGDRTPDGGSDMMHRRTGRWHMGHVLIHSPAQLSRDGRNEPPHYCIETE